MGPRWSRTSWQKVMVEEGCGAPGIWEAEQGGKGAKTRSTPPGHTRGLLPPATLHHHLQWFVQLPVGCSTVEVTARVGQAPLQSPALCTARGPGPPHVSLQGTSQTRHSECVPESGIALPPAPCALLGLLWLPGSWWVHMNFVTDVSSWVKMSLDGNQICRLLLVVCKK